uniref:ADAM metallopeptidase domain 8b n=1 Tax=Mastacembelus armatus TaxID=205130 RepID=A0A7N9AW21_9TELE
MLSHVERYEVVRPQRLQERHKRSLQENQIYPDTVRYQVALEGRNHTIHLEKNRNLIGRGYTETHYSEDGRRVTTSPDEDHCYYHGHVEGMVESSVSVGICSGISGFVRARQQVYLIEPLGRSEDADHAVYREEDLKMRSRRGSNTTVLDRRLLLCLQLYRALNIRIMLVGLEIWTYRDYIEVKVDSEKTLDNFLSWRQADLLQREKHDNAQFVTAKGFDRDTVGLANKFAICTKNSGGVNQDHHENPIGLASTIAHEMGHNFGLSHDSAGCVCATQAFPEFFSSCSVDQLAEFMERAQPSCLDTPSSFRTIAAGPRCGNALLDPGEECDCGTVEECKNRCCDASTCRLTDGSQCAHGQCCDNCQFRAAGSVCRSSAGECDLPEYCSGLSQDCPEDGFEMNGKPCYNQVQGYCYDGQCPTHEQHCWRLFGSGARVGPDRCFELNQRGEESANCGRNKFSYIPCTTANLKCGSIFCGGGGDSITGKLGAYTVLGIECKLAVEDDKSRNIDMVPQGTKCGPNKVCLDNRCVDISVYGKTEDCAKKCNNNGVSEMKITCSCFQLGLDQSARAVSELILSLGVKVHSAPGRLNPMFQEPSGKERLEISQPTFMESTATQFCAPVVIAVTPSRPAPQVPTQTPKLVPEIHGRRDVICYKLLFLFQPPVSSTWPTEPVRFINKDCAHNAN